MSTLTYKLTNPFYPRLNTGIRVKQNFDRWFLYRTSRHDRFEINESAVKILRLCDGSKSVRQMINDLKRTDVDITDIRTFLNYLGEEKIIDLDAEPKPLKEIPIYNDIGPSWVVLHVTNRCNLRCRHCYVNAQTCKQFELSREQIFNCISQLKDMGVIDIIFTGGEPFIREDFLDILRFTAKQGVGSEILTNGTLISKSVANDLSKIGIDQILVSLDGSRAEIHESLRRVRGSWQKAIQGVTNLKTAQIKVLANTVINRNNIKDLPNMPPLLTSLKVDGWRLGTLFYVGRSKAGDSSIDIELDRQIEALAELDKRYFLEKWPFNLSTTVDWESIVCSNAQMADRLHICGMTMGKHLYIRANGDALVCDRLPNLVIGNVLNSELPKLWSSALVKEWKFKCVDEIPGCRKCPWHYLCGSGCRANAKLHTGEYFQRDPVACLTIKRSLVERWEQFPKEIRNRLSRWIPGHQVPRRKTYEKKEERERSKRYCSKSEWPEENKAFDHQTGQLRDYR